MTAHPSRQGPKAREARQGNRQRATSQSRMYSGRRGKPSQRRTDRAASQSAPRPNAKPHDTLRTGCQCPLSKCRGSNVKPPA